jgi:hypothetical protein
MKFKNLDVVVLDQDLPEEGLKRGDVGTIVHVLAPGVFLVEFVLASGETAALVELKDSDIRPGAGSDLGSVRTFRQPH